MSKRRKTKAASVSAPPLAPASTPAAAPPLAPASNPAVPVPVPLTPTPPSKPLLAAAGLTLVLALLATDVPGHRFPALYDTGRFTLAIGALLTAVAHLAKDRLAASRYLGLVRFAPLLLVALGLSALVARHGHDFRLFSTSHSGLFGAAPELALIGLTTGLALRVKAHPSHATPLGLGLGLVVALFIAPDVVLGEPVHVLPAALARLTAPLAALTTLTALVALLHLIPHTRRLLSPRILALAPAVLGAAALLPAFTSTTPLVALAFVAALATLHLGLVDILGATAPTPDSTGRVFHRLALLAVLGLWLLLKAQALIASNTDENIYFYMAKTLADGQWPYADYFFAHPPLHVILPGVLFSTFGFSLTFAKLLPLAACFIGGLALHATLARHVSRPAALLTLILYLFAAEVLKASSNMTGVNMTTMFLLLGTWQALAPRPFTAGILLGLAPATGFYAMAPALAVLAMCAFYRFDSPNPPSSSRGRTLLHRLRRLRLAQPLAFILTIGGINLIFWAIGGDTFLEGVYSYHQQKFFQDPKMVELFGGDPGFPISVFHNLGVMVGGGPFIKEVFYHPHLWLSLLLVPLVLLGVALASDAPKRRLLAYLRPSNLFTSADGRALFLTLVALALLVQFAMFRELYSFYFALIYPFLAAGTGWAIHRAFTLLKDHALGLGRPLAIVFPLAALSLLASHSAISLDRLAVFENEIENAGTRNAYEWTPAPVLDSLSPIVQNLFWDDFRFKADVEPGYRHYLWTKKRGFTRLDDVAAEVVRLTRPDQTIAGSSTIAPLVALVADRRLAANEADTNNKRFRTGILKEADYWNAACQDDLQVIVAAPRSYFTFDKIQSLPLVRRFFGSPTIIEDRTLQYRAPFPIALFPRGPAPCAWIDPTSPTPPSTAPDTLAE